MSDWYSAAVVSDFNKRTGWSEQLSYSNAAKVGKQFIDFKPPSSFDLSLSSKTSPHTYSSMVLSNKLGDDALNGSIAYIYENVNGKLVTEFQRRNDQDLHHDYFETFNKYYRMLIPNDAAIGRTDHHNQHNHSHEQIRTPTVNEPFYRVNNATGEVFLSHVPPGHIGTNTNNMALRKELKKLSRETKSMSYKKSSLFYGKMLFPYSVLEATHIYNTSKNTRFYTNAWSNKENFCFTSFYQFQNKNQCHEFCFSSPERLAGYRSLYKFSIPSSPDMPFILHDDEIQLGSEWWFGLKNMAPNCSFSFRYKTITGLNNERPLHFTISMNPLMGHIQSTFGLIEEVPKSSEQYDYRVNNLVGFFSQYYFNIYSLKSNLSFGMSFQGYKIGLDLKTRNVKVAWNRKFNKNFILSTGFNMNLPVSFGTSSTLKNVSPNSSGTVNTTNNTDHFGSMTSSIRNPIKFGIELKYIGD
ncbi:hypothetical protein ACO0QE_004644 [Hanseniaspora vineae]